MKNKLLNLENIKWIILGFSNAFWIMITLDYITKNKIFGLIGIVSFSLLSILAIAVYIILMQQYLKNLKTMAKKEASKIMWKKELDALSPGLINILGMYLNLGRSIWLTLLVCVFWTCSFVIWTKWINPWL